MNPILSKKSITEYLSTNSNTADLTDNDNNDMVMINDSFQLFGGCDLNDMSDLQPSNPNNNKVNHSIDSLNLLTNHDDTSYVHFFPDSNKTMSLEFESYARKLPLNFIDTKDWGTYLQFVSKQETTKFNESKILTKHSKQKLDKVQRLLNSILNLYTEYSKLCECYELMRYQVTDAGPSLPRSNNRKKPVHVNDLKADQLRSVKILRNIDACCQTISYSNMTEIPDSQMTDLLNNNASVTRSRPMTIKTNKRNSSSLSSDISTDSSKIKRTKIYDHLIRQNFLGSQSIEVIEKLRTNRAYRAHKISVKSNINEISKTEIVNHTNFSFSSIATALSCATSKRNADPCQCDVNLISLPILLDLLLPKMQLKIQQILQQCTFLHNPLEIMAELRYLNYNTNATIEYFNETKQLRSCIEEFMSDKIDSQCQQAVVRCLYADKEFRAPFALDKSIYLKEEKMDYDDIFGDNLVHIAACQADEAMNRLISKSIDIGSVVLDDTTLDESITRPVATESSQLSPAKIQIFTKTIMEIVYGLKRSLKETLLQLSRLRQHMSSLLKTLRINIDLIMNVNGQLVTNPQRGRRMQLAKQVEQLKLKLKDEEIKRRSVYNLMQEQLGNVRVYCRCRDIPNQENVLHIQDGETISLPIIPKERFDFDNVFESNMNQSDIYEHFKPLVMSFIDGFNVCFITYGSEASGKTYTLIGGNFENKIEHGLMQRAINTVLIEQRLRDRDWDYQISACLIEIYNDNCIDMLSGETGIQLYVDCGMELVYQKLKSVPITNDSDVEALLMLCRMKRKIAKTALNPASSRSHLITLIRLAGKSKIHGESTCSFMCLCDLAGFEDIIKAETQSNKILAKEAGYINKSLTAFNRVFVSLRRQDPNTVCYRDSKLTHFLKPFLTNSGKCALIVTIRTDRKSLSSTQNTLRFGRETRGISLGKAHRQVSNDRKGI